MGKLTRREVLKAAASTVAVSTLGIGGVDGGNKVINENSIPRRPLGKTGEDVSILTFGGFHLREVMPDESDRLLNFYLDSGGNFIETARGYGDSEKKIGRVMKSRRSDCFLSTKTGKRTAKEAMEDIEKSLANLQTDHLDSIFIHGLSNDDELKTILSPDGALAAFEKAREQGKVRFIAITSHNPEMLYKTVQSYPFDLIMEWMNYYDRFNFPLIYDKIIPFCLEKNIGLMAMKPVGDGFLYRSPEEAFRWVWSLPIATAAAGNNTMELLKKNIELAKTFKPMSEQEKLELYATAPEYSRYVCRRCGKCANNSLGLDTLRIFELEGYYDRQMYTGDVPDAAEYALRERLRFWFGQQDFAGKQYKALEKKVPLEFDETEFKGVCPYGIDLPRKLRLAAWKLTGNDAHISL